MSYFLLNIRRKPAWTKNWDIKFNAFSWFSLCIFLIEIILLRHVEQLKFMFTKYIIWLKKGTCPTNEGPKRLWNLSSKALYWEIFCNTLRKQQCFFLQKFNNVLLKKSCFTWFGVLWGQKSKFSNTYHKKDNNLEKQYRIKECLKWCYKQFSTIIIPFCGPYKEIRGQPLKRLKNGNGFLNTYWKQICLISKTIQLTSRKRGWSLNLGAKRAPKSFIHSTV